MLEYRERNGNKHIVSDNELNAFACVIQPTFIFGIP